MHYRFTSLLAVTTLVRGFGAGLIYDVALVSLPVRRQIGVIPYTQYAIATLQGPGIRTYGPVSLVGALLTIVATVTAFAWGEPALVRWSTAVALLATALAFFGTFQALPAVLSLRTTPADEALLAKILDRFAYWHTFSTVWQIISFIALIVALAN